MKFPAQSRELRESGYTFDGEGKCRGCGVPLEWWITPAGRKMPLSRVKLADQLKRNIEALEPHWASCPNAKDFRR